MKWIAWDVWWKEQLVFVVYAMNGVGRIGGIGLDMFVWWSDGKYVWVMLVGVWIVWNGGMCVKWNGGGVGIVDMVGSGRNNSMIWMVGRV